MSTTGTNRIRAMDLIDFESGTIDRELFTSLELHATALVRQREAYRPDSRYSQEPLPRAVQTS